MSCKFDTFLLQDYIDGEVDQLEKIFVEEHLKTCRECRKEISTLKLLFWELDDIRKSEISMPDIQQAREEVIERLFDSTSDAMNIRGVIGLQKKNMSAAGKFVKFIPGVKAGEKYIKSGIKKAPVAALKLTGSIIKGGFKLVRLRLQS